MNAQEFLITYTDHDRSKTYRGPFDSFERALEVFENAPVMPGHSAYLEDEYGHTYRVYHEPPDEDQEEE